MLLFDMRSRITASTTARCVRFQQGEDASRCKLAKRRPDYKCEPICQTCATRWLTGCSVHQMFKSQSVKPNCTNSLDKLAKGALFCGVSSYVRFLGINRHIELKPDRFHEPNTQGLVIPIPFRTPKSQHKMPPVRPKRPH